MKLIALHLLLQSIPDSMRLLIVAAAFYLGACSTFHTVDTEPYLPPPRSELVRAYELESAENTDSQEVSPVTASAGADTSAQHSSGFLRPRFRITEGFDAEDPIMAMRQVRDSVVASRMPWTALEAVSDSLMVHRAWYRIRSSLPVGLPVALRRSVWPTDAHVVKKSPSEVRVESDWMPLARLSNREIRCSVDRRAAAIGKMTEVRLVGTLGSTAQNEALIRVGFEVRGGSACQGSPEAVDRLRAFAFDLWSLAHRSASGVGSTLHH